MYRHLVLNIEIDGVSALWTDVLGIYLARRTTG